MRMLLLGLLALLFAAARLPSRRRTWRANSTTTCCRSAGRRTGAPLEGDARDRRNAMKASGHGWILHGLWPQFHRGYPSFCRTAERPPSRGMTSAMADIMGTSGLAWHQWKKHGTCTGLSATGLLCPVPRTPMRRSNAAAIFRKLDRAVRLPASVVEDAFLQSQPGDGSRRHHHHLPQ